MLNGKIVQYRTKQRKAARCGHPALEAGSLLWLIQYSNGRLFTYGYVLKVAAAKVKDNLDGSQREIEFNSVDDPEKVIQSWIEPVDIN